MKRVMLTIGILMISLPIFAAVEIPRPFWVKSTPMPPVNSGYVFAWGEGVASNAQDAKNKAFADAIKKASYELGSVSIDSQSIAEVEQNGLKAFIDPQKRAIKETSATSAIVTKDGEFLVYVLVQMQVNANYTPNFYAYPVGFDLTHDPQFDQAMSKYADQHAATIDAATVINERENIIIDFVNAGKKAEQRLQIDDALRDYYWALVLAISHPKQVMCTFNGEEHSCITYLPIKIKSVLSQIKAEILESEVSQNNIIVRARFSYLGHDISSLKFSYFDGQSTVGPSSVRDGIGEMDLSSLPVNDRINIAYEYRFRNEAINLDGELQSIFNSNKRLPTVSNADTYIPVKVNNRRQEVQYSSARIEIAETDAIETVEAEKILTRKRINEQLADDTSPLLDSLIIVETAIRTKKPHLARACFTENGYALFEKLINETGNVSLSGKSNYRLVKTETNILARSCCIKIKFSNGRSFIENLTFRFNLTDNKIESIAFALTQKAEEDLFKASAQWSAISRYHILNFMEDYQTAYALKREDYLRQIFSDNAIIITGTVLEATERNRVRFSDEIDLSHIFSQKEIIYTKHTKDSYFKRLREHFSSREYIHLTFEDNITRVVNTNNALPDGALFAIQIRQLYTSPSYSDNGYLTLMMNMQGAHPLIEVRLWEPDQIKNEKLEDFVLRFDF